VGVLAERMSYLSVPNRAENVPSWGRRRSAMSMSEATLSVEIRPLPAAMLTVSAVCSTPSTRWRTKNSFSCGSMCTSVAPACMAEMRILRTFWIFSDCVAEPPSVLAIAGDPSFLSSLNSGGATPLPPASAFGFLPRRPPNRSSSVLNCWSRSTMLTGLAFSTAALAGRAGRAASRAWRPCLMFEKNCFVRTRSSGGRALSRRAANP
jgi:hypothetical protein